ncbi:MULTISPECIES: NUMOD4 domain-containing protein [unclassified Microbacterium]|uniref:NUMOD4 domain-containing protein n=1 Tax=unclassified Microbacterium TaxID=2609290 RepID=UPI000EA92BCF|nr:hypothetical protein [Microbacterium sp. ISL-108]RKN68545.1 hypothetical protein D7252_13785 [Microbacterium sp. CGR2]
MNATERWQAVEGYEGCYEISDVGRVRSLERLVAGPRDGTRLVRSRILRSERIQGGYHRVDLCRDGVTKHHMIHQMVAIAFVPGSGPNLMVLHNDGDSQNNHMEVTA